jgi:catechol 2,3-dioxygenase-like lactoylglutathione lyase family enzyme
MQRRAVPTFFLCGLALGLILAMPPAQSAPEVPLAPVSSQAFAYVVVSVADMDRALGLWVNRFGMEIVARREGHDAGLARAWGLAADAIVDQALLRTPGSSHGGVHLVRFKLPGKAVREGAVPTDLVPKSIDIAVVDIQKRYDELTAAGYAFRSPVGTMESKGVKFFEAHMPAHDGLNLVLVEQPSRHELTSAKGYGAASTMVFTTRDNLREATFFQSLMGLELLSQSRLAGPQVEKTIGLPPGAGLDIRILGEPKNDFGRLEIVQYEGVQSQNLYPRAVPPARGMLSVTYIVSDLSSVLARGATLGVVDHGKVDSILGNGRMASVTSPTGLRVDLLELRR